MCILNLFSSVVFVIVVIILSLNSLNIVPLKHSTMLIWKLLESIIPEPYNAKKALVIKPENQKPISEVVDGLLKQKRLAEIVREKSTLLTSQTGLHPVYKIPLDDKTINITGCKSYSFGEKVLTSNRTIMVSGATGAGKSTLINGMINYILGVRWEDSYRFKLVDESQSVSQDHSQTSEVVVYKLYHQKGFKIDYSLTIVDTPGFGDIRGVERDKQITEQLRNLFSDKDGVGDIDTVCFVAPAFITELTLTQKYIFDSVLSIFGKDVGENIRILVTFADGQLPPVVKAIEASGVPCSKTDEGLPVHFKFNNSALFADNKSVNDDKNFDQMVWNMGTESMKRFFASLNQIKAIRLTMTNEVLKERQDLESSVEKLQEQVKHGLAKFDQIKETRRKLKENEEEIRKNEHFEFEITVKLHSKAPIAPGKYITNCQQCLVTCHYPCLIPNNDDKIRCTAMGPDGFCLECPGKCFWNVHFNETFRWICEEVKEKQTVKELKEKYEKATGEKMTLQELISKLKAEYQKVQDEVVRLMEKAVNCLNRLKEIALNRNPLSTPKYIDMLIEGEKKEAKKGWEQRVGSLNKMKNHAEIIVKVERGEKLLAQ